MKYSALSKYRPELMGGAMLWVMLFHTGLDFGLPPLNWIRSAGFGGVDIFIVLSAVGLVASLSKKEQKFGPFMARRALRILPAYFLVMVPYTIYSILRGAAPVSALLWNSTLLSYWVRAPGGFNWYISAIMLFYAVTPACFRCLKKSKHRELLTAAGVLAGIFLYRFLIHLDVWGHLDVAYRVPVFFLGLLMGFYAWEERKLGKKDILFWCFWSLCGLVYLAALPRTDIPFLLPLGPLFLFTTVPMCLVICLLFEHLPLGGLRQLLRLVGENSLEIYLLNVSFFSQAPLLQQYLHCGPKLYYLIVILLNLILGILLHRIMAVLLVRVARRRASVQ